MTKTNQGVHITILLVKSQQDLRVRNGFEACMSRYFVLGLYLHRRFEDSHVQLSLQRHGKHALSHIFSCYISTYCIMVGLKKV